LRSKSINVLTRAIIGGYYVSEDLTYKKAGVDIEAGYETVKRIRSLAQATFTSGVSMDIGSFGGGFALGKGYAEPVLIAGTDGVGTKLKIAFLTGKHDTVGIDVVAYCVNDIICQGAKPIFFLDYLAMGKLVPEVAEAIVKGVSDGCIQAGCALIGGETAEMPGFYQNGEYDLAGFAVGVAERSNIITGKDVAPGDIVMGLASTGLQSSGYSLVRKVVLEKAGLTVDDYVDELGCTVGEELLRPTGIYVKPILELIKGGYVKGIANISGGGLPENLPRSMAENTCAVIDCSSWQVPPVFEWLKRLGSISNGEMFKTFNMGIGMCLIIEPGKQKSAIETAASFGENLFEVGIVEKGAKGVRFI
jgi:phosphoribosylformylglycinamidine cyclo-ligase